MYDGTPCAGRGLSRTAVLRRWGAPHRTMPHFLLLRRLRSLPYRPPQVQAGDAVGRWGPFTLVRRSARFDSHACDRLHRPSEGIRPDATCSESRGHPHRRGLAVLSHRIERVHHNRNGQHWRTQLLKVFTKVTLEPRRQQTSLSSPCVDCGQWTEQWTRLYAGRSVSSAAGGAAVDPPSTCHRRRRRRRCLRPPHSAYRNQPVLPNRSAPVVHR
jgi:hypothetical protein